MKKEDLEKIYLAYPQVIKYGKIFPICKRSGCCLTLKFKASVKFSEYPWPGKNSEKLLSVKISEISEDDLKTLREIKDAILSSPKLPKNSAASFKFLRYGIIFAKFGKHEKIWATDVYLTHPPMNQKMCGEVLVNFKHVFIGADNPHRSISCVLESFSCLS